MLKYTFFVFMVFSCEFKKTKNSESLTIISTTKELTNGDSISHPTSNKLNPNLGTHIANSIKNQKEDSIAKQKFYENIILPMLKKDKEKVLSIIHLPLTTGDYLANSNPVASNKRIIPKDFLIKNYDRFFNEKFISAAKKIKPEEIGINRVNDTTIFNFIFNGESSSLVFEYCETHNNFSLKAIYGAGGDFYAFDRDKDFNP